MDITHLNMVRTMAKSLTGDSQLIDNIMQSSKTDLLKSLLRQVKMSITSAGTAEFFVDQVEAVENLLQEFPRADDFSSDTKAFVSLYRRVDRNRFFKLGTMGLRQPQIAATIDSPTRAIGKL